MSGRSQQVRIWPSVIVWRVLRPPLPKTAGEGHVIGVWKVKGKHSKARQISRLMDWHYMWAGSLKAPRTNHWSPDPLMTEPRNNGCHSERATWAFVSVTARADVLADGHVSLWTVSGVPHKRSRCQDDWGCGYINQSFSAVHHPVFGELLSTSEQRKKKAFSLYRTDLRNA